MANKLQKMPHAGYPYYTLVPYVFQGEFSNQMNLYMVVWQNTMQDYINYYLGNCFESEPSKEDIAELALEVRRLASRKHAKEVFKGNEGE